MCALLSHERGLDRCAAVRGGQRLRRVDSETQTWVIQVLSRGHSFYFAPVLCLFPLPSVVVYSDSSSEPNETTYQILLSDGCVHVCVCVCVCVCLYVCVCVCLPWIVFVCGPERERARGTARARARAREREFGFTFMCGFCVRLSVHEHRDSRTHESASQRARRSSAEHPTQPFLRSPSYTARQEVLVAQ